MDRYPPPPPYQMEDEQRSIALQQNSNVKRKPISYDKQGPVEHKSYEDTFDIDDYYNEEPTSSASTAVASRPGLSILTSNAGPSHAYSSPAQLHPSSAARSFVSTASSPTSPAPSFLSANGSSTTLPLPSTATATQPTPTGSFVQNALRDARHFAGGLIQRPTESTKHFTIVRHSHGLVFYQGTSTSIAITVFSDAPLPPERKYYLQSKGYSGKTGMRLKAFIGKNGDWLDITPTTVIRPEQCNPSDERAWQRDITKFQKKGPSKIREKHLARETTVLRIPADAGDGYFQIVMCVGEKKKVLCPSPVFRVISTSKAPSSLRGASLATLPLELGVMVGSLAANVYAQNTIGRVTAVAAPAATIVQGRVAKFMPSFWTQQVASTAYGIAGDAISSTIADGNAKYHETKIQPVLTTAKVEAELEKGPQAPYPLLFTGRSELNVSNMIEELDMPNFGVIEVNDQIMEKLHGYYFGWARNKPKKAKEESTWCQAIISVTMLDISQMERVKIGEVPKKSIALRLMTDFDEVRTEDAKFEVQVLGFIRPDEPVQRAALEKGAAEGDQAAIDAALISEYNDVSMAQQVLDHPAWAVEVATRPKLVERKSSGLQKISESYVNTRIAAQRQFDKIPLNKVGVRLESDKGKDIATAVRGVFILR